MGAFFSRWFGNIRLTAAIAALAIGSITIAILAVSIGVFVSLSGTAREDAATEMASATRITTAILQVKQRAARRGRRSLAID
jgi:methyl-accepting chemotaxis protein